METSGPAVRPRRAGSFRRLVVGPSRTLRLPRKRFVRVLAPVFVLFLIGLVAATNEYLIDKRDIGGTWPLVVAIGTVLPLGVAARWPVIAWRIAFPMLFLGTVGWSGAGEPLPWSPTQIVFFLAVLGLVAITEDSRVTIWATGLTVIVPFFYVAPDRAVVVALPLTVIAMVGEITSRRRRNARALAEQTELTELERARRAVLEERTRIAREMHDVVAHHMSMIAVQAETAPYRVTGLNEAAQTELASIATSARAALVDMRRLLGVLRADDEQALTAPQPGLGDLGDLVGSATRAGIEVTLTTGGLERAPGAIGLAAYRIVQEALANAARHAPGSPVDVRAYGSDDRLELEVRNGPPRPGPIADSGSGHGLIGMRERAELLGGTLRAGPEVDGGFRVAATLPYEGAISP